PWPWGLPPEDQGRATWLLHFVVESTILIESYSHLAAICWNKTVYGDSKMSLFQRLRLILCLILRIKTSDKVEKSVATGRYLHINLLAFSIAHFE
ncbi:MAG: hypothetical protein K2G23_00145, partial [Muribaculaceae bacterium]|nr:hypothetical protein [Muribaculaceae bacterium]